MSTQYDPHAHQYAPPPPYPPAHAPRNGMGTAALVLGIIAIALAWIPFIGFIGFVCGVVGAVLGIAGWIRVSKHQATNKGVTIAGTVLSVIAVIVSIAVFVTAATAVGQAIAERGLTSADVFTSGVAAPPAATFTIGDTIDVEGLHITLSDAGQVVDNGQNYLCAEVAYDNQSPGQRTINPLSWEVQGGDDAITTSTVRSEGVDQSLKSSTLDTGGKATGEVCWNKPVQGGITMIWTESPGSSRKATWIARL